MVNEIAAAKHAKPGQIALAWLLQKGEDIVPIPGTKRRKYLEENVAAESVELDPAQMKVLDDALAPGRVSGKRYADWIMATIDRCGAAAVAQTRTLLIVLRLFGFFWLSGTVVPITFSGTSVPIVKIQGARCAR
jgi:hypothetical protein